MNHTTPIKRSESKLGLQPANMREDGVDQTYETDELVPGGNADQEETIGEQSRIWIPLLAGEICFNACRKGLSLSMTIMQAELGLTKPELGFIASSMSLCYTMSKGAASILTDFMSNRKLFACGLALTGLSHAAFSFGKSVNFFALCWGLNGMFQGAGWPAAARLLVIWYPANIRPQYWAIVCSGTNFGGAMAPLILMLMPWRVGFFALGVVALIFSRIVFLKIRDVPPYLKKSELPKKDPSPAISTYSCIVVLGNCKLWLASAAAFCLYFVMQGIGNWAIMFLIEDKGYTLVAATSCFFWYDAGGIAGSLGSGTIASWTKSRAIPCVVLSALLLVSVLLFPAVPSYSTAAPQTAEAGRGGVDGTDGTDGTDSEGNTQAAYSYAMTILISSAIGFFTHAPKALLGILARESVPLQYSGSGGGLWEMCAEAGATAGGFPIGLLHARGGWPLAFNAFTVGACMFCVCCIALTVPTVQPVEIRGKSTSHQSRDDTHTQWKMVSV
jgi:OPA family sugar phosphate sensor protein UhpC-like MFS transporter